MPIISINICSSTNYKTFLCLEILLKTFQNQNPKWSYIPDRIYKGFIIDSSELGKNNALR